ncbi:UPF0561 protein C2orf68 homolog [Scyliorhinus canicula]|uniref:UPF0561 protein C2orf68 homolog n=1 Tax=Scyliorhinus canicula TaxID=7830 RepID=UPI0018F58465|nr:UPF0561 protein C2orf68 homolog [Scyliorhinus canicula]
MELEDQGPASRDAAAAAAKSARLDMSHGFVRHIRRNQIARDDYDKEVRQAKEKQKKRQTPAPVRPRKPDLQMYHPRRRNGAENSSGFDYEESNGSSSGTDPDAATESENTELFCLDYQAADKIVTSVVIHQGDDPEKVAEKIGTKNSLEPLMKEALRVRIQEEIEKRISKRCAWLWHAAPALAGRGVVLLRFCVVSSFFSPPSPIPDGNAERFEDPGIDRLPNTSGYVFKTGSTIHRAQC